MPPHPEPSHGPEDPFAITKPQAILAVGLVVALTASAVFAAAAVPRDWYTPDPPPAAVITPDALPNFSSSAAITPDASLSPFAAEASPRPTDQEPLGLIPFPEAQSLGRAITRRQGVVFHTSSWQLPPDTAPQAAGHYARQLSRLGFTARATEPPGLQTASGLPPTTLFVGTKPNQPGRIVLRFTRATPPDTRLTLIYSDATASAALP
ncbi:MAG: hypothetical protein AAGI68_00645 [Planctomycetota bacterium]